jgi:hypothetical protein
MGAVGAAQSVAEGNGVAAYCTPGAVPSVRIATLAAHGVVRGAQREVLSFSSVTGRWQRAPCNPRIGTTVNMLCGRCSAGLIEVREGCECDVVACGGVLRLDCNGFNELARAERCMWGAANNGAVYVFDLVTHAILKQLDLHTDAVRALCVVSDSEGEELVASGSGTCVEAEAILTGRVVINLCLGCAGSADGTLALWQQHHA